MDSFTGVWIEGMWRPRISSLSIVLVLATACTYGPEEERVVLGRIVGVRDSYEALVVIQYERFRPATGLTAFPDGGKAQILERWARLYSIDASARSASLLTEQAAPDSLWESFSVSVQGLAGDSISYLRLTGCPRDGECHPRLQNSLLISVSRGGSVRTVADIPSDARLPGVMLARRTSEERYVRFSSEGNTITARFEEDGPFAPLLELGPDGSLTTIGR